MKLKMNELVVIRNELDKIVKRSMETRIRGSLAIKFARILKDVEPMFADFDKARGDLLKRLGKPDPDKPDMVMIAPENVDEFNKEFGGIMAVEITLTPTVALTDSELDEFDLDIVEATALLPFIKPSNDTPVTGEIVPL
jgi:hypothetical protein